MNWVDKRIHAEKRLAETAIDVWNDLRVAVQEACDTYRIKVDPKFRCEMENGLRMRITKGKEIVLIGFEEDPPTITVTMPGHSSKYSLVYDTAADKAVLTFDNKPEDGMNFCQNILEEWMFAKPRPKVTGGYGGGPGGWQA